MGNQLKKLASQLPKYLDFRIIKESNLYFLVLADLWLLILFWIGFAAILFDAFEIYQINLIHRYFLVWVVDLVIISLPLQVVAFMNYFAVHVKKQKDEIALLKEKISNNIEFASRIGQGHPQEYDTTDDELSQTLMNLGKT